MTFYCASTLGQMVKDQDHCDFQECGGRRAVCTYRYLIPFSDGATSSQPWGQQYLGVLLVGSVTKTWPPKTLSQRSSPVSDLHFLP